jgi:hypothetical protein
VSHNCSGGKPFFFFLLFFCDIFFLQGRGNKCTKQSFYAIKSRLKKTFLLSWRNFVLCSFRFYMFYVNCCLSFSIPLPSAYSGANSVRGKCAILLPLLSEKTKKTFCVFFIVLKILWHINVLEVLVGFWRIYFPVILLPVCHSVWKILHFSPEMIKQCGHDIIF